MITDFIPKKEDYSFKVYDVVGDDVAEFVYKQATIQETIDFYSKHNDINALYTYFIDKFCKNKKNKEVDIVLRDNIETIFSKIANTRYKRRESEYSNVPQTVDKKRGVRERTRGATVQEVCKHFFISLTDLLQNYTMEQYDWMVDQIIFSTNESTDDWKRRNNIMLNKNKVPEVDKKKAMELLKKSKNAKVVAREFIWWQKM